MQVVYTHHGRTGPITTQIDAGRLPIRVQVTNPGNPAEAHVVAPGAGAAQVGPSGMTGQDMSVTVGRSAGRLARLLGGGASVSAGSVRAQGRGSIAAGGSIAGVAVTGHGNVINGQRTAPREPGVYLTLPHGSRLNLRSSGTVTVVHAGGEMSLDKAVEVGLLHA